MSVLVGVTGLAGAGKTTAVRHLARVTNGCEIYLGRVVLEELERRGVESNRENERRLRMELREQDGAAALLNRRLDEIIANVSNRVPVFVDAIFSPEELHVLGTCAPTKIVHLVAIDAAFGVRCARLEKRFDRPFNRQEVADRDSTELQLLGTGAVMNGAGTRILNEGSLEDFYEKLSAFLVSRGLTPRSV